LYGILLYISVSFHQVPYLSIFLFFISITVLCYYSGINNYKNNETFKALVGAIKAYHRSSRQVALIKFIDDE